VCEVVRGYLGRQKAKLLREAVAEQEALAKEMLQDVKASSIAAYDMQTKLAKEDAGTLVTLVQVILDYVCSNVICNALIWQTL
jgi:hypothetical protein